MNQGNKVVERYFRDLWERWRRCEAKQVRYKHWPDSQLSKCHDNVDAYVSKHPGCKAIRGAWVQPIDGTDGGYLIAHSLIGLPDGEWVDITPFTEQEKNGGAEDPKQRANLVFLEHRGTDEQFQTFCGIVREHWPPITMPNVIEPDFGSGEDLM